VTSNRFITDSSLGLLARRLRMLGYDVQVLAGARFEEVLESARREDRIVLTMSARHPQKFADVVVRHVARERPAESVREIAAAAAPSGAPFTRCPACNTALQRRLPMEARGEVPGAVLRTAKILTFCPHCGKWFWEGSHVARMREWLEEALGRPLES
jgi:uncharacterized protein with PIN domain